MALIDLNRVALRYGGDAGTLAVEDCSLTVRAGEFVALVGPSGCGKSSLLKVVSGLHRVSAGSARLHGAAIEGPPHGIGMAFQNATLLPWRTTLENVLLPLEVGRDHRHSFRRKKQAHIERAMHLLGIVGLTEFRDHPPTSSRAGCSSEPISAVP
jgi:NitT/TauT family transport system ATP-binding protein